MVMALGFTREQALRALQATVSASVSGFHQVLATVFLPSLAG